MTMSARYCQRCGGPMQYMDYGPKEFRAWGLACAQCEGHKEDTRKMLDEARAAKRKKSDNPKETP